MPTAVLCLILKPAFTIRIIFVFKYPASLVPKVFFSKTEITSVFLQTTNKNLLPVSGMLAFFARLVKFSPG